jgi:hypothetical protein
MDTKKSMTDTGISSKSVKKKPRSYERSMICMSYRIKVQVRSPVSSPLVVSEGVEILSKKSE